jgi:biopolymer transport protein ExbD
MESCCGSCNRPAGEEIPGGFWAIDEGDSEDLSLPASSTASSSVREGLEIRVSATGILVGPVMVAALEGGKVDERAKPDGDDGFLIETLREDVQKEVYFQKAIYDRSKKGSPELKVNLLVHKDTSYRVITEVIYSIGQGGAMDVVFVVSGKNGRGTIPLTMPKFDALEGEKNMLTVMIEGDEISVSFGDDMQSVPRGTPEKLGQALRKIKDDNSGLNRVGVGAGSDIPYEDLVEIMDAVREDGKGKLFKEIVLVAGSS